MEGGRQKRKAKSEKRKAESGKRKAERTQKLELSFMAKD
jgi:hypothetical protein